MNYLEKIKAVCPQAENYQFLAVCMEKDSKNYGAMYESKEEAIADGVKEVGCQLDIFDAGGEYLDGAIDTDEASVVEYFVTYKQKQVV